MSQQTGLTLYTAAPSRGAIVRWMLEEVGAPYEVHVLDLMKGEQLRPDYLAINPMGKVPALRHGETIVTEVAAICCYLADAFPAAGLAPAIGDHLRGPYLKWLFFGPSCLEPAILERRFPRKQPAPRAAAGFGNADVVFDRLG